MKIRDFTHGVFRDGDLAVSGAGLLTDRNALQEAELLNVQLEPLTSTVAILFDTRTALQVRESHAGVLVGEGVRDFGCSLSDRRVRRTAWSVVGSEVTEEDGLWQLVCYFSPDLVLRVQARSFAFCVGKVPGLSASPPDYLSDSDEQVRAGIAGWDSTFVPIEYEQVIAK
ncbi:hypothetical protein [Streptomyces sp. NPDC049881]|uniref:hypothetical protein n=1 Tax=Streptomyces sp. NPDC049881 TaxID=3155778 RepID=UPI003417DBCD